MSNKKTKTKFDPNSPEHLAMLAKGREQYQKGIADGTIKRLNPIEKSHANPKSLRMAVNAMCFDCCGRENWHNRTKYCHIVTCPLWSIRKGHKDASEEECLAWSESATGSPKDIKKSDKITNQED